MREPAFSVYERCGKPGGGKGLLIYEDVSHTVTANGSFVYLFAPKKEEPPIKSGSCPGEPG